MKIVLQKSIILVSTPLPFYLLFIVGFISGTAADRPQKIAYVVFVNEICFISGCLFLPPADASTKRPQPVFILSIKSSLNDFIPDKQ